MSQKIIAVCDRCNAELKAYIGNNSIRVLPCTCSDQTVTISTEPVSSEPPPMDAQGKAIELVDRFQCINGNVREALCSAFSEAIEWGRNDSTKFI